MKFIPTFFLAMFLMIGASQAANGSERPMDEKGNNAAPRMSHTHV